ncbi:hypothetical protein T484DRAFT_1848742, partial [Baffinella frigidus]
MASHVLGNDKADVEAVRLVLGALEQLRACFQKVKLAEQDSSARECSLSREVAQWKTSFWLDLDYVEVARAALKCDAHVTALLYMELSITQARENAGGGRGGGPSDSGGGILGSCEEGELLLLRAYRSCEEGLLLLLRADRQIDEPDGMEAFNRRCDFPSLFVAWEHTREWSRYSHLSRVAAEAMPALDQEARFEALWRSEAWDVAAQVHSSNSPLRGYHSNVYLALKALGQGLRLGRSSVEAHAGEIRRRLDAARHATMLEIGKEDLQVTKHAKSLLLRLQSCEDLDQCLQ